MGLAAPSGQRCLLLLALLSVGLARAQLFDNENVGYYDPCNNFTQVQRGDAFVFGVSYWPGYTVQNWGPAYNTSSGTYGLQPCIGSATVNGVKLNYTKWLGDRGAVVTSYAVTVDKLAVLRITKAEFDQMWDNIAVGNPKAVSMVAFRGQNRSEARYAASNEPYLTQGTGVVTSTALIISWDRGNFVGFQWQDFQSCAQCGGIYDDRCVRLLEDPVYQQYPQTSCAAPFADCACRGLKCVSANCTTGIYVAHRGTDKKGAVMKSAQQMQALNNYSVTGWLQQLLQKVDSAYDNQGSLVGSVGEGNTVVVQLPDPTAAQSQFESVQTQEKVASKGNCDPFNGLTC